MHQIEKNEYNSPEMNNYVKFYKLTTITVKEMIAGIIKRLVEREKCWEQCVFVPHENALGTRSKRLYNSRQTEKMIMKANRYWKISSNSQEKNT